MKELNQSPLCEKVIAFTRKDEKSSNKKIEIIKLNFENPDETVFKNNNVGFNSLGSTIKKAGSQVRKKKKKKIFNFFFLLIKRKHLKKLT